MADILTLAAIKHSVRFNHQLLLFFYFSIVGKSISFLLLMSFASLMGFCMYVRRQILFLVQHIVSRPFLGRLFPHSWFPK